MISKGHYKTAFEKEWLETVVEFATESSWLENKYGQCRAFESHNFEVDHIIGAKAKRKIIGVSCRVGELAIMPIPFALHNVISKHPYNRTTQPGRYRKKFGHEKQVWLEMIRAMQNEGHEIPFNEETIQSIMG